MPFHFLNNIKSMHIFSFFNSHYMNCLFLLLFFMGQYSGLMGTGSLPVIIEGQQPNLSIDNSGIIRMVYGNQDKIYCITSSDNGLNFSTPALVAELPKMHLGSSRGPQIASSSTRSLISAIDKNGNIHSYILNHLKGIWTKVANVSDSQGSAVEGLMALASDKNDNFYATWLDIRDGGNNNIYFSSLNSKSRKWSPNTLVYKSPDKHVCECCKPNIVANNGKVVIGFRNWLMGARDIYYAVSTNKGKSFIAAVKSGNGSWQLNACPMDGGSLALHASGKVSAAWRRNGDVYYWTEKQAEQKLAPGRDVSMAQNQNSVYVAWHDSKKIQVMNLNTKQITEIGTGTSPKIYVLDNEKAICLWEDNKSVRFKII